jgi:transposase
LRELTGKAVSAAQMEIARLKAELAKPRMARDNLKTKKAAAYFARESRRDTPLARASKAAVSPPP